MAAHFNLVDDSFEECLRDLHWLDAGRVVIIHDGLPTIPARDLRIYLSILHSTADGVTQLRPIVVVFPSTLRGEV